MSGKEEFSLTEKEAAKFVEGRVRQIFLNPEV
jgi:hypothetical protein